MKYFWENKMTSKKNKPCIFGFLDKQKFLILLLAMMFLFAPKSAFATTFQDAVDAAEDGIVNLNPGEDYTGSAIFSSDVVVNGHGARIIVGDGDYSSVSSDISIELNNLTIDGGLNGIYLAPRSSLHADQVTFKNISDSGISSNDAALVNISDSTFQTITKYGINLYSTSLCELISGCTFTGIQDIPILTRNSTVNSIVGCQITGAGNTSGDAISIQDGSSAQIDTCDISNATAGVAIVKNSNAVINNCQIHNNLKIDGTIDKGQGIYLQDSSSAQISGTTVENNDNAGLYCQKSEIEVSWSIFTHNGWVAEDGEGIDCKESSTGYIHDSQVTSNFLIGIQGVESSIVVEDCEIRNNRLGGISIKTDTTSQDAVIKGCLLDTNYDASYTGGTTHETVLYGVNTTASFGRSYAGFNRDIGILVQNEAHGNIESSLLISNTDNNINVYHADIDVNWSSLGNSSYGIYFNTANSSSVHNTDFFNHSAKHAQSQDSTPWPDCTENWWGSGGDPGSSAFQITVDPWLTEQVAYYCLDRNYNISAGADKQFSFTDLPIDIKVHGGTEALANQIFVAFGSHHNIFTDLPEPSLSFTPSPNNIVYMWINASLETRIGTKNQTIEFYSDNSKFENPNLGEILKFDDESQQWQALETTFIASENRLQASVSDVSGKYILYTNENVCPIADFSVNPSVGDAPLLVKFTDSSANNPTSWHWDFDDGYTSDEQNPAHIFENSGSYDVALTASNSAGDDVCNITVNINVCSEEKVQLNSVGFQDIDAAYTAANEDDIIQLQAVKFNETLQFDKDISVNLQGGYNCVYDNLIGKSTIIGGITIETGCLELSNIEIK